jgi:flagellar basal-body rod protein FlgF
MDRGLYVAMTGAKQIMQAQAVNNHNIANVNTVGFRADAVSFVSQPIYGVGLSHARERRGQRRRYGFLQRRLAEHGARSRCGGQRQGLHRGSRQRRQEAYTRAGDLRVSVDGCGDNRRGLPVLTESGPLVIPPATTVTVGNDGTVSVLPLGLAPTRHLADRSHQAGEAAGEEICRRAMTVCCA